jgi:hypothetical protein
MLHSDAPILSPDLLRLAIVSAGALLIPLGLAISALDDGRRREQLLRRSRW